LTFVVHPARARPVRTALLLAWLALAAWGLALLVPLPAVDARLTGGALFLVMLAMLGGWFLPTRYAIDLNGIEVRRLRRRFYPWSRFRGWRRERTGYFLSPFSDTRRFDNFRGLFIFLDNFVVFFSGQDGSSVSEALQAFLEEKIGGDPAP
jgi:hypothetical protein